MRIIKTLLLGSALGIAAATANAQDISCGTEYTVKPGDFLSSIAQRAYGSLSNFTFIYDANIDVIGPNPGIIRIGQNLVIPCLADGASRVVVAGGAAQPIPSGARDNGAIRVLSGSGWRPFLDEDDPQGGLLTEIVELALVNNGAQTEYEIDFVNDLDAHLAPLLTKNAFDVSVGQLHPDCNAAAGLGAESRFRCDNFLFSDPLYEEIFGYYSMVSDPEYTDHQELRGKTICRAANHTLVPLEAVGLSEPEISIVRASSAATCIDLVMEAKADVALVAIEVANARIQDLRARDSVQMHESLSYVDFFHAAVSKDNPRADAILASINTGLGNIKESGLWFQTVRRHMIGFRESNS